MTTNLLKLFIIISCFLLNACSKTIDWQEEALLRSGQKVIVDRSVKRIPTEPGQMLSSIYEISTKNPTTGERLSWQGVHGVGPILLDFKNGQVFMVVTLTACDAKIKEFSVEGLPYIFLSSVDGKNWVTISPSQFPSEYKSANLSFSYDPYYVGEGKFQSSEQISTANEYAQQHSSRGYYQVSIPRSKDEWNYQYKSMYHVGCY